jgi:S1-C subfamily serine protease
MEKMRSCKFPTGINVRRTLLSMVLIYILSGCGAFVPVVQIEQSAQATLRREVAVLSLAEMQRRKHENLGFIEAYSCKNKAWDPNPSPEDAGAQLRLRAQNMGANAIGGFQCEAQQGTSFSRNCWSSVRCTAQAIRLIDNEISKEPTRADTGGQPEPKKPNSFGTGFFVNGAGSIITNAHVVQNCTTIKVDTREGTTEATVVSRDQKSDLALLRAPGAVTRHLLIRSEPRLRPGEPIVVLGFPLSEILSKDGTVATGTVSALSGVAGDTSRIQISAPIQPGNSGGPVLDQSGNIIGVAVSKLNALAVAAITGDIPQNVNFAVSAKSLEAFLDANGYEYQRGPSVQRMDASEVAERAKSSVVRLSCSPGNSR